MLMVGVPHGRRVVGFVIRIWKTLPSRGCLRESRAHSAGLDFSEKKYYETSRLTRVATLVVDFGRMRCDIDYATVAHRAVAFRSVRKLDHDGPGLKQQSRSIRGAALLK